MEWWLNPYVGRIIIDMNKTIIIITAWIFEVRVYARKYDKIVAVHFPKEDDEEDLSKEDEEEEETSETTSP